MLFTDPLRDNRNFRRLYAKGRSCVGSCMVLYGRKNRTSGSRLGITVGGKVGNAVVRNKIRRRLREIYRLHESELAPGFDMVIVARGRAAGAAYACLESEFMALCGRLGIKA